MPSIVKSYCWFVRVTLPHSIIEEKIKLVSGWIDTVKILCLLHKGNKTEKEHCHFTVQLSSEIQKQSFDVRIKKVFDVKGSDYSSKPWDGEPPANTYMFHDSNYRIVANKGYDDATLANFRVENEKVQKVVEINKSRGPSKIVENVIQNYTGAPDKIQIASILLQKIRIGEMYEPGNYKLNNIIEEIFMKLQPEENWENYCQVRINQILRC